MKTRFFLPILVGAVCAATFGCRGPEPKTTPEAKPTTTTKTPTTTPTAPPKPVQSGVVKLADASIEYFSQGEGQAVVLLPGGSLTVGYLDGLSQALANAGYRVVRINFRGSGKSTGSDAGVTLHTFAADVAGVIEALKLQPANVGGHAFGNRVARMLAADQPELVRSVILFAPGGKVPPEPPAQRALKTIFDPTSTDAEALDAMKYMVGKDEDVTAAWQMLKPCRAPSVAGIEKAAMSSPPLKDWWAPAGEAKYLVLQGSEDQAAPPQNGELLQQELGARVTLVSIPGAGHLMLMTQPRKTANAIASFLH